MKQTLKVTGMVCEGCSTNVKQIVSAMEGVKDVEVDLASGMLTYDAEEATTAKIKEAIDDAGFEAEDC